MAPPVPTTNWAGLPKNSVTLLRRSSGIANPWSLVKSRAIEHGAAMTYHTLGSIAQEQRDFAQAEQWYRKSLAISEKLGNEHRAASDLPPTWAALPENSATLLRLSSGTANPWPLVKSWATSLALP